MANAYEPSFGSLTVNGQLVPVFQGMQFASGNAQGPRLYASLPNVPQTIPLTPGNAAVGGAPPISASNVGLGITPTVGIALAIMLVIGVAGLRYIHWRG